MRRRLPLLLAVCAACQMDAITTVDPVVTFDGHVWAGGVLHLSSPAFVSPSLPLVILGNDTLVVQRLDSVTLEARVPDTSGTLALNLDVGHHVPLGSIVVHGLLSTHVIGQPVNSFIVPMPWPRSRSTFLVGVPAGYQVVDSRTGSVNPFFPTSRFTTADCFASPSAAGGDWLVLTTAVPNTLQCRSWLVVPAGGALVPMDSLSFRAHGHLVDGTWISISQWMISQRSSIGASSAVNYGEASLIAVSPAGNRGVPLGGRVYGGPFPLFQAGPKVDSVAVPPSWGSIAAAYDASGDTVYMLGARWVSGGPKLMILDAVGGDTLRTITDSLPAAYHPFPTMDLAVDPLRPWIYVASVDSARLTLVVYDRASLKVAAMLHAPYGMAISYPAVRIALDALGRKLGVVVINQAFWTLDQTGMRVFSFDLLP